MTKYNIVVTEEQKIELLALVDLACKNTEGESNAKMGKLFNCVSFAPNKSLTLRRSQSSLRKMRLRFMSWSQL